MKEIGKVALLTAQEEVDLAKRIEAGEDATQKLTSPDSDKLTPPQIDEFRWLERDGQRR